MYGKDWRYVLKSEPQKLRQRFNFYRCHSANTIQQAGGRIKREKQEYVDVVAMR